MQIECSRENGILVIRPDGRVDSIEAVELQQHLGSVVGPDDLAVVIDMESLSYISSGGLRAILEFARSMRRKGGRFAVCCLSDSVQDVFKISGFDRVVPISDSHESAINAVTR